MLLEERNALDVLIEQAEKSLETAPEGTLKVSKDNNRVQYFHRTDVNKSNGIYIRKKDNELAKKLAQKDYDIKFLSIAKMRREGIQKVINNLENIDVKSIYNDLSLERQELIQPYVLPDEIYIKQWQDKIYVSKSFADDMPEIYTEKGERVRSKSEKIIADKLALMGIPYHYEYPLKLNGFGVVYPDFTLLNKRNRKEYYLEHFGMMDNPEYSEKVIKKLDTYNKNGIYQGDKLLVTYETSKYTLNIRNVEKLMEKYLL